MLRRTQTHGINLAAAVSVIATFSVLSPLSREADNDTNLGRTSAEEMRRHRPIHFQIGTSRFCTLGSLVDKAFGALSLKMANLKTPIRRTRCEMCQRRDVLVFHKKRLRCRYRRRRLRRHVILNYRRETKEALLVSVLFDSK